MTKLFKNSKSVLSLVLAFAVLAVSLFTGVVINADAADCKIENVVYYGGGEGVAPTKGTGAENDPFIIETAENLLYIVKNGIATEKEYYKVADGVDAFVLQTKDKIDAAGGWDELKNLDAAGTMTWFDDPNKTGIINADGSWSQGDFSVSGNSKGVAWQNWNKATIADAPFMGHFDGNGVTIYGMLHTASGSLFGYTFNATIENLAVRASYVTGYGGAIISDNNKKGEEGATCNNTFRNISVEGCCVLTSRQQGSGTVQASQVWSSGGVMLGTLGNGSYAYNFMTVENCYVNDAIAYNFVYDSNPEPKGAGAIKDTYYTSENGYKVNGNTLSAIGSYQNNDNNKIMNSVFLGAAPYCSPKHNFQNGGARTGSYSNVYTDAPSKNVQFANNTINYTDAQITTIDPAAFTGIGAMTVCSGLNWSTGWFANEGTPVLRELHNITAGTENKHSEVCADCGINGVVESDHSYVDGKCTICGKVLTCGEEIAYWNGTADAVLADNGETGADWDNAIIIDSAEELNYLFTQCHAAAQGKYYKVADHIGTMVLQPENVIDLDELKACADADAVKSYIEGLEGKISWNNPELGDRYFNGNFDGNGVAIYGMYGYNHSNKAAVGLIQGIEPYFNTDGDYSGTATDDTVMYYDTDMDEPISIGNFVLRNSYVDCDRRIGLVVGMSGSPKYGAKLTGKIEMNDIEVSNCYAQAAGGAKGGQGILSGENGGDLFTWDNILVYGNKGVFADGAAMTLRGQAGTFKSVPNGVNQYNSWTFANEGDCIENTVENSIVLGTLPYDNINSPGYRICGTAIFENVYTDAPVGEVTCGNYKFTYAETDLADVAGLTGAELKAACGALDWENTFLATSGMPNFRAMHDAEFEATYDSETHSLSCSCGLAIEAAPHNWSNKDGVCADGCGYKCTHDNGSAVEFREKTPATCTQPAIGYRVCTICGLSSENMEGGLIPDGDPLGHDMVLVKGTDATCTEDGVKDYYDCSRCDHVSEDEAGEIAIENLDEWKVILAKGHTLAKDEDGVDVYIPTEAGHQKVCGVCDKAYGDVEAHQGTAVADGANGHAITCTVAGCGYAAESAPHVFGDDSVCDTCTWECTAHTWVDDGEPVELDFMEKTKDACKKVAQKCEICGIAGEDRVIGHTAGEWEKPYFDRNQKPACASDGSHTEIQTCTECMFELDTRTVTDAKTGHSFSEVEASDPNCVYDGNNAYKYCPNCNYKFALDAADDEAYENALTDDELYIPADPEAHVWVEFAAGEADCENDGYSAGHKLCSVCKAFVVDGVATDIVLDYDKFYEVEYDEEYNPTPIGIGAIADVYATELMDEMFEQWLADQGIVLPEEPAEDADLEEWNAYYAEYNAIMSEVDTAEFEEMWNPILEEIWNEAYHQYFLAEAEAAGLIEVEAALGHNIVKVDEVPATYEADGVKAHWACENCDKLFADEEGENEVTAEDLVIAKLVKEDEKPADKPADTDEDKTDGDSSDKSPATGESVASVAAVAALMGAAYVLIRKARKA